MIKMNKLNENVYRILEPTHTLYVLGQEVHYEEY